MVVVVVSVQGGPASGPGPSPATSVTVTEPAAVHVNPVVDAFGALNVPEGADHEYVSDVGSGPLVDAVSVTALPTVVSLGLARSDWMLAQFVLAPMSEAWPESAPATRHSKPMNTGVVVPALTLKVDDVPVHVTLLSVDVPVRVAVKPKPDGSVMLNRSPLLPPTDRVVLDVNPPGPTMRAVKLENCSPPGRVKPNDTLPVSESCERPELVGGAESGPDEQPAFDVKPTTRATIAAPAVRFAFITSSN